MSAWEPPPLTRGTLSLKKCNSGYFRRRISKSTSFKAAIRKWPARSGLQNSPFLRQKSKGLFCSLRKFPPNNLSSIQSFLNRTIDPKTITVCLGSANVNHHPLLLLIMAQFPCGKTQKLLPQLPTDEAN